MTAITSTEQIRHIMIAEIRSALKRNILPSIIEEYKEPLYNYLMEDFHHNLKDESYYVESLVGMALDEVGDEPKTQMIYDSLEDDCDCLIDEIMSSVIDNYKDD